MDHQNGMMPSRLSVHRDSAARLDWLWDILLIGILLAGAYFRFTGLDWDQNQHLHPDERFLTMVETSIAPVDSLAQYFDTQTSTLNPHNRGYGFYVYGTLPLFIVRYVGEWLGKTGYDEIHLVGRQVSALMDLGTVLVVYLIAVQTVPQPAAGAAGIRVCGVFGAAHPAFALFHGGYVYELLWDAGVLFRRLCCC